MDKIIVTTHDELKTLLINVLDEYLSSSIKQPEQEKDRLSLDDTIRFFRENGYQTSKSCYLTSIAVILFLRRLI